MIFRFIKKNQSAKQIPIFQSISVLGFILSLIGIPTALSGLVIESDKTIKNQNLEICKNCNEIISANLSLCPHCSNVKSEDKQPTNNVQPMEILKSRYAKGEISKEEFENMKKDIE